MSVSSISSTEPTQTIAAAQQSAVHQASRQQNASSETTDQVKISAAAQALQLHRQGQSISQIALALSITTKTVEAYLGDTTNTSSTSTSAQATGDAQGAALLAAL